MVRTEKEILDSWENGTPLVSIICNTYNHCNFIEHTLQAFLNQRGTFQFEILIHDDASSDGTQRIIREYEQKYPNLIKPIYQSENQYSKGIKPAFVYQYPRAKGKYIALCEGDDYWTDEFKLEKQISFLEKNPEFAVTCTNYSEIDRDGKIISVNVWDGIRLSPVITHLDVLEKYKPKFLTVVFKKSALKEDDPSVFLNIPNTDNFLAAILTQSGPIKFMNFNSGCYRVHNQGVWSGKNEIKQFEMQLDTFQKMKLYFKKEDQQKSIDKRIYNIKRKLSRLHAKKKELGKSLEYTKSMLSMDSKDSVKVFLGNLMAFIR